MARLLLALSLLSVVQAWAPSSPLLPARADLRAAASEVQEVIERGEKPSGVVVPCPTEDVEIVRLGEPISVEDVTCEDGEAIFEYWTRMTVQGEQTQEYFSKLMKEAKKNANFPGFKKGQIPPYARPQMVYFCLEEAINTGMLNALDSASVKPLEGENAKAEVGQLHEGQLAENDGTVRKRQPSSARAYSPCSSMLATPWR